MIAIAVLGFSATAGMAGDASDKATGLPLHPGMTFDQEVSSDVCGRKAKIYLYDVAFGASMADYLPWYKEQLKGFHYVHQTWSNRPQEMFYSADGTKGVTLTGVPQGSKVFAASYLSVSPGLTAHEMEAFSPSNPSCK